MGTGRKLRPFEVREIRWFFDQHQSARAAGEPVSYTLPEIGSLYGVTGRTVWDVGMRLTFIDVPDEPDHPDEGKLPPNPTKDALRKRFERAQARNAGEA